MRSEEEMMDIILGYAHENENIRVVGMEGSRTNENVPKDKYRDYDITYLVTNYNVLIRDDEWLSIFGKRLIMQKPEAMSWFPPENPWFSYLMLFEDGNKIDLTIAPIEDLEAYLNSDKLLRILLDKDSRIDTPPIPTDRDFWIAEPTAAYFDDVCNEFWNVAAYVAKGLCRNELLFANHHLEQILRPQLLTMIAWEVGSRKGYDFSLGKHYKFLQQYLPEPQWTLLMETYRLDAVPNTWKALFAAFSLFRAVSRTVAERCAYIYPDYDENITGYISSLYEDKQ